MSRGRRSEEFTTGGQPGKGGGAAGMRRSNRKKGKEGVRKRVQGTRRGEAKREEGREGEGVKQRK